MKKRKIHIRVFAILLAIVLSLTYVPPKMEKVEAASGSAQEVVNVAIY